MVNELAPRVHNSGHYSSDALVHDQFLLHVMAVAGLKLPKLVSQKSKGFAMHNLLGENWSAKWAEYDLYFHWYGKSEVKPGRKMGHITALDHSPETALQKLLKAKRRVSMESK